MSDLIEQIDALLHLDAKGRLVPHGIGGLARELLTRARDAIASPPSRVLQDEGVVAWRRKEPNRSWTYTDGANKPQAGSTFEYQPLYTAPPAILPSTIGGSVGVSEEMVTAALNAKPKNSPISYFLNPNNHLKPEDVRELMRAALTAALSPAISGEPTGWQPIETARKIVDETVLLRIEHMNYAIADDANKHRWEEVVTAYWTDFNSGGWVWHGLAGAPTHWQPLPASPSTQAQER
jgi:hypothetical protein